MFGSVKLTKNLDPDKYTCHGYSLGFNSCSESSLTDGSASKDIIFCGVDMRISVHIDNRNREILILGIGPTQD